MAYKRKAAPKRRSTTKKRTAASYRSPARRASSRRASPARAQTIKLVLEVAPQSAPGQPLMAARSAEAPVKKAKF